MKQQVLIYGNRKQDDIQFPFSTQKEKEAAFLRLFEYLRIAWEVYGDLTPKQRALYEQAKQKNGKAAIRLLSLRRAYEYERWHVEKVPAKAARQLSRLLVPKPHWADVKAVRTDRQGDCTIVRLTLSGKQQVALALVPYMVQGHDVWEKLNEAQQFVIATLDSGAQHEMHNAEALKKALHTVNELWHCLHYARFPETAPPRCSPDRLFDRVSQSAEAFLVEHSNTPLEELTHAKRVPTELDEAKELLAEARRCIGALAYHFKKLGNAELLKDLLRTYKQVMTEDMPV